MNLNGFPEILKKTKRRRGRKTIEQTLLFIGDATDLMVIWIHVHKDYIKTQLVSVLFCMGHFMSLMVMQIYLRKAALCGGMVMIQFAESYNNMLWIFFAGKLGSLVWSNYVTLAYFAHSLRKGLYTELAVAISALGEVHFVLFWHQFFLLHVIAICT